MITFTEGDFVVRDPFESCTCPLCTDEDGMLPFILDSFANALDDIDREFYLDTEGGE